MFGSEGVRLGRGGNSEMRKRLCGPALLRGLGIDAEDVGAKVMATDLSCALLIQLPDECAIKTGLCAKRLPQIADGRATSIGIGGLIDGAQCCEVRAEGFHAHRLPNSNLLSIPFGTLPEGKGKLGAMTAQSQVVARRRKRLQEWIELHYHGVQSAFVAAAKVNQGEVSALLKDKSFGEKRARRLEQQAKMPEGYLDSIDGSGRIAKPISNHEATPAQPFTNQRQKVRVEGMAAMDEQGFWKLGSIEVDLWEVNTDDSKAYAIRVLTQHFQNVAAPGQCLLVSPSQELKLGRWVLVTMQDGRRTFRTYRGHEYGMWHFAAVNDQSAYLDLSDDEVASVERVMSVSWTD